MTIEILKPGKLSVHTDASLFDASAGSAHTATVFTGQAHAVSALRHAFSIAGEGYHIIALGKEATARLECINTVLQESGVNSEIQLDRVLLPQAGSLAAYTEVNFQAGDGVSFIHDCQRIVNASIAGNPALSEAGLKTQYETHGTNPLLSDYLQRLEQEVLSTEAASRDSDEYNNSNKQALHSILPVLLLAAAQQKPAYMLDAFPDTSSLLGRVSANDQSGRISIHSGTLIQASGTVLIVDGRRLSQNSADWRLLRDILKSGSIPLDKMVSQSPAGSRSGIFITGSISLKCRVVLLCDGPVLDKLYELDPEIENVFSAVAEFETEMSRNAETSIQYAALVTSLQQKHQCLPLDSGAMAGVIDFSARSTDTQHRLTLNRTGLVNLLRSASILATNRGAASISRQHIDSVIRQDKQQVQADCRNAQEAILAGETLVELSGSVVGQINGLTMVGTGVQSYLEPSRITATVRAGDGAVVDIEREVSLGGSIHSKGVMILASLLAARYSRHIPLSLVATLVLEQSYSDVDGDSASAAEMMAILSAVTEIPIKQNLAITGSIDQRGQILCVGDINNKLDGYFQLTRRQGNIADAGVVIPAGNLRDLMLDDELVDAVEEGRFTVTAISSLDDLIEVYTGMPAGQEDENHEFPSGSFNDKVHAALKQFSDEKKDEHSESN